MQSKIIASLSGLFIMAIITGCETAPTGSSAPEIQRTRETFAARKERVWPILVSQVGLDYPVRAIEKDSGLITTDWVTLPAGFNNMDARRWIAPPGGFLATWDGLRMNMKVMAVETEPGQTSVTINCHYEAFENNVQKAWLAANSNGSLENAILSRIEQQLRSLPSAPAAAPLAKPAPITTEPTGQPKSAADSLLELKKLLDAGAINQDEYNAKKKSILEKL
jgi:hypothetical protein